MQILKYIAVTILSLIVSLFLWEFFTSYIQHSRAAAPSVTLSFSPLDLKLKPGESADVSVALKTDSAIHKISAVDLTFVSTGTLDMVDISAPANAANGDHSIYNELLKQVGPRQSRISYISIKDDTLLPSEISFVIRVKNTSSSGGSGLLQLDSASSKVTGNITEHTYTWNKVDLSSCNNAVTPTGGQSLNHVSMEMSPEVSSMSSNETRVITVAIHTDAPEHKISAFDLTFLATGGITIQSVGKPVTGASSDIYTPLVENVQGTSARVSYVAVKSDAQLPSSLQIPVTVKDTGDAGILLLDRPTSAVAGNIVYHTYVWDVTGSAIINWSSLPVSPAPGGHQATVTMNPTNSELAGNASADVTVTLTSDAAENKISAFDFVFITSGNLSIGAVVPPAGDVFMPLVTDITPGRAHVVFTSLKDNALLPATVSFKVTVTRKTDGTGTGTLELDSSTAKITGTIPQNNYTVAVANGAQFYIQGIAPTAIPQQTQGTTAKPSSTPAPTSTIEPTRKPTAIPQTAAQPIDPKIKWAVVIGNTIILAIIIIFSFL